MLVGQYKVASAAAGELKGHSITHADRSSVGGLLPMLWCMRHAGLLPTLYPGLEGKNMHSAGRGRDRGSNIKAWQWKQAMRPPNRGFGS